jgi:hypothetical protein
MVINGATGNLWKLLQEHDQATTLPSQCQQLLADLAALCGAANVETVFRELKGKTLEELRKAVLPWLNRLNYHFLNHMGAIKMHLPGTICQKMIVGMLYLIKLKDSKGKQLAKPEAVGPFPVHKQDHLFFGAFQSFFIAQLTGSTREKCPINDLVKKGCFQSGLLARYFLFREVLSGEGRENLSRIFAFLFQDWDDRNNSLGDKRTLALVNKPEWPPAYPLPLAWKDALWHSRPLSGNYAELRDPNLQVTITKKMGQARMDMFRTTQDPVSIAILQLGTKVWIIGNMSNFSKEGAGFNGMIPSFTSCKFSFLRGKTVQDRTSITQLVNRDTKLIEEIALVLEGETELYVVKITRKPNETSRKKVHVEHVHSSILAKLGLKIPKQWAKATMIEPPE